MHGQAVGARGYVVRVLRNVDDDTVGQKTVPMLGYFAKIDLEQIRKNGK